MVILLQLDVLWQQEHANDGIHSFLGGTIKIDVCVPVFIFKLTASYVTRTGSR